MTNQQKAAWQKIENEIHTAFKNVKLDDGIGYFEAEALDAYLLPAGIEYQQEKAKDERGDWTKLLATFKDTGLYNDRHCFMDAKGLRFYLPFLMIRQDQAVNSILHFYISEVYDRPGYTKSNYSAMVLLLSAAQKQCVYHFYSFLSKFENSDFSEHYLNADFETGEEAMKGFDFMHFIEKHFGPRSSIQI